MMEGWRRWGLDARTSYLPVDFAALATHLIFDLSHHLLRIGTDDRLLDRLGHRFAASAEQFTKHYCVRKNRTLKLLAK